MLIQGSAVSGKTDYLINSYINLLNKGTDASKILVLCLNSYKLKFTHYQGLYTIQ